MQSGDTLQHYDQPMTVSPSPTPSEAPSPLTYPPTIPSLPTHSPSITASSPPVTSPSLASSPPLTSHASPLTSRSNLRLTTSSLAQLEKQATLTNKLRLIGEEEDEGRSDIRVLSPSLVNSQVLSKTRPLSPDPPDPLPPPPPPPPPLPPPPVTSLYNGERLPEQDGVLGGRGGGGGGGGRHRGGGGGGGGGGSEGGDFQEDSEKTTKGRGRGRRRQRQHKLKFHHQALPPEYLDHYEASLRQEQRAAAAAAAAAAASPPAPRPPREALDPNPPVAGAGLQGGVPRQGRGGRGRGRGRGQRAPRPITIHEAGGAATEALLRELLLTRPHLQQAALTQAALARAQSVPSIMLATPPRGRRATSPALPAHDQQLPYMGEMQLDERPRRGRKPKKADITHLISKNYGVAGLPGSGALHEAALQQLHQQLQFHQQQQQHQQHQQQQPQQPQHYHYHYPPTQQLPDRQRGNDEEGAAGVPQEGLTRSRSYSSLLHTALTAAEAGDQSEPLNLCVRDDPGLKCDPEHPAQGHHHTPPVKLEPDEDPSAGEATWAGGGRAGGPYWLQDYRLKTEDGLSSGQSTPSLCSQSSHLPSLSPPAFPHMSPPPNFPLMGCPQSPPCPSPLPTSPAHHHRNVHALLKESLQQRLDEAARERLSPQGGVARARGGEGRGARAAGHGARRKRSALFIPPADPNTEVSICKFKFTGGPNPVLEEKKMVSVGAGGRLRYCGAGGGAGGGRDLRLSGKLIENITKCEKDVKKIRLESDTEDTCSLSGLGSTATSPVHTLERGTMPPAQEESPKRKRRSKKSSVREKLEQTLRERGLLIQTQQVESAEGATYCKFRQLRKFTRYLFRSWKDYLPGQLQEGGGGPLEGYSDTRPPPFPSHMVRQPPSPDHR